MSRVITRRHRPRASPRGHPPRAREISRDGDGDSTFGSDIAFEEGVMRVVDAPAVRGENKKPSTAGCPVRRRR